MHIGGYITPEISLIKQFCDENNLLLIEDAAHAHGAESVDGKRAGSIGHAAAFSFFPTKVMTTGEGGMVTTSVKAMDDSARLYRDQGKDSSGIRNIVHGSSWRLSELHAALGCAQIELFQSKLLHRRRILERYQNNLISVTGAKLAGTSHDQASGHKAILLLESPVIRDNLRTHLSGAGIGTTKGVYDVPIHLQPVFKDLNKAEYPLSESFAQSHICLPIHSSIQLEEVEAVTNSIKLFFDTI